MKDFSEKTFDEDNLGIPDPGILASSKKEPANKAEGIHMERETDALSAKILQSWATCPLKGKFLLAGTPTLPLSGYGREIQEDGKEYEKKLIERKSKIERLVGSQLPEFFSETPKNLEIINMMDTVGKFSDRSDAWQAHLDFIQSKAKTPQPALFYQVIFSKPGPSPEVGVIDLLLWTGKTFLVGEIKLTSSIKEQTAFQLTFYKAFLEDNGGLPIEDTAFIIHCREGWIFNRKRSSNNQEKCLENSELLRFNLQLKSKRYLELFREITDFEEKFKAGKTSPSEAEGCHVATCWECGFRDRCHKKFLGEEGNPSIYMSGLNDSDMEILSSLGITTCKAALDRISGLKEIHGNHPNKVETLRRRLKKTIQLGGYSTWTPPVNPAFMPTPEEKILFFCQKSVQDQSPTGETFTRNIPQWFTPVNPSPTETIPDMGTGTEPQFLIAFNAVEMEFARNTWLGSKQKTKHGVIPCLLEREILQTVWFPFPTLTLQGITTCLHEIASQGSWYAFLRSPSYEDVLLKAPKEELPRHTALLTLYRALKSIREQILAP